MKKLIDTAANTITFTFDAGEPVVFNPAVTSEANRTYAILHGFSARIGDSAAQFKTEAERRAAILNMVAHYSDNASEWNVAKSASKPAPQNPVILEIASRLGLTYEAALAKCAGDMLANLMADMPK